MLETSTGYHGRESLESEFESTSAIRSVTPDFVPKPIAWGSFETITDAHFYLCEFRELGERLPEAPDFCKQLATLHKNSVSPNGKYGFHVVTYNGDLPQENKFTSTWEEFFANGLRHMLSMNVERAGHCKELDDLKPGMFVKVIPRLLRPLDTGCNSIKPSLVHGDLWCSNAAIDQENDMPLIFDPAAFWAHNECRHSRPQSLENVLGIFSRLADEMGNWRPERKFSQLYFKAYQQHFEKAALVEDYDDRNSLHAL